MFFETSGLSPSIEDFGHEGLCIIHEYGPKLVQAIPASPENAVLMHVLQEAIRRHD
jgi:hypothetical protein